MWNLWGSLCTISCHLQVKSFTSSFSIWTPFVSFSCWLPWLEHPVLWWIRAVKANILVLFLILRGMLVVFPHWVWCWQWVCHTYGLYYVYVCFLHPHAAESFYHKWVLDFIKCFFCIYLYDHVVFILHFVYVVNHIYWFANVVPTLHSWNKSHLIMVHDHFNVLLDPVWCYFV